MPNAFGETLQALGVPMFRDPDDATTIYGGPEDDAASSIAAPSQTLQFPDAADCASSGATAPEKRGGVDVFVGGGGDDLPGLGVMRQYAGTYAAQTGRPTAYFPNNSEDQIVEAIRRGNRDGGPVNVVGHSWGGPDGYQAVARATKEGLRVDNLITLDPVGGPLSHASPGPSGARWTNVETAPTRPNFADRITNLPGFSHKPSYLPTSQADTQVALDLNHDDVDGMMQRGGARAILDRSRQLAPAVAFGLQQPTAQQLHDNLPMMEWMRQRQAQAGQER